MPRRGAIFVLDDELEFHMLIQAIFSKTHNVYGEISIEKAKPIIRRVSGQIDVVLLDIKLSDGKVGWDIIPHLPEKAKVIVVTAAKHYTILNQASRLGVYEVVWKPVQPSYLRDMVNRLT